MSEMHRPTLPPAAPNHDQHDPLLVAQLVAGDALDPARAGETRAWLATCADCAQLASDLGAVRAAVASEPVPPRRRDFRLTSEQAAALKGNALTRFMRGLSFPRARAFAPAAAGLLSVGLVFVVAGFAWPEEDSFSVGSDADIMPAAVEERVAQPSRPPGQNDAQPDEPTTQTAPTATDDGVSYFLSEPEALEEALHNQVGSPPRSESMQKALEAEAADELTDAAEAAEGEGAERGVAAPEAPLEGAGASSDQADDAGSGRLIGETDVAATAAVDSGAAESSVVAAAEDGARDRWRLHIGAAVAVAGGLLL